MTKYIDADRLRAEITKRISRCKKCEEDGYPDTTSSEATLKSILSLIDSLQQEQLNREESVWVHKKYNREYRIVSNNARLKNSNGEWIDCVIYAPVYENEFEMFAREKESFYKEFEKK